jgi:hypothetical protein
MAVCLSLRLVNSLACQLRRPRPPTREGEVATVAMPTPACTVTIGGHRCIVRGREGKRGARGVSRVVERCSKV